MPSEHHKSEQKARRWLGGVLACLGCAMHPEWGINPSTDQLLDTLTEREAYGRAAEPWEIANVIVFLASDLSTYMTGEIVSVSSQRA